MTPRLGNVHPHEDQEFLLALLNTTPVVGGTRQDTLRATAPVWAVEHGGTGSDDELEALATARDTLQQVVSGDAPAADLTPLLISVSARPVVTGDAITWEVDIPRHLRMAVRAVLAWDRVEQTRPNRLRPCGNDRCALFLLDRSRAGSARWCSMATCGNRMKAQRHHLRGRT